MLVMLGAAVVFGFGGSLRGHEIFLANLHGMRKHLLKGKEVMPTVLSHFFVVLLRWFRGGTDDCYHLTPLASETKSGLAIRRWVTMLIVAWDRRGVRAGPLFQDRNGEVIDMGKLDGIMHKYLLEIQSERPDLIPKEVDVVNEFSFHRSLRRGSTTQARNQGVSEADINTANRWRNVERAGGRKPARSMMEHYSQIHHLVPTLVRYSQAL